MTTQRVLIIGAGIAGCATALSLSRLGMRVTLIEKQSEWRFQSSGIFIYNNGLAALNNLGVLTEILESGFAINDGSNLYLDHLGHPITTVYYPAGPSSEPPIVGIKRADMHQILATALEKNQVTARLGLSVKHIIPGDQETLAQVTFSDGSVESYDLVIAADGIRSLTRQQIFGSIEQKDTGFGVWRSVHRRPSQINTKIMQMGIGKRLGIMPISDDRLYIFGTVAEKEVAWYDPAQWPQIMQRTFSEFQGPVRAFLDELSTDSEILYTRVEEVVAPLPWHQGRVLLIGDAAHASTPFMGQGGAMALEDAVVLAECLHQNTLFDAFRQFEERRFTICQYVQNSSRKVGEAGAIEDPTSCLERNSRMRDGAQKQVDVFYKQLEHLRRVKTS